MPLSLHSYSICLFCLPIRFVYIVEVIRNVRSSQILDKLFIVCNDNQLEVGLCVATGLNDTTSPVKRHTFCGREYHPYFDRFCAKLSIFSLSRFVVGSSKASTPHWMQNVSANARRMIIEVSTFWPALQRPRILSSFPFLIITT